MKPRDPPSLTISDLRHVLGQLDDMLIEYDPELKVTYINKTGAYWTGAAPDQLAETTIRDLFGPAAPAVEERVRAACSTAQAARAIHQFELARGMGLWHALYLPIPAEPGKVARVFAAYHAQDPLHSAASLLSVSGDAVLMLDPERNISSWNPAAASMFGYPPEEVLGKPILILVPSGYLEDHRTLFLEASQGNSVVNATTVRKRKDGSLIDVAVTISPLRDTSGNLAGFLEIIRNITEQKRAAEQLKRKDETLIWYQQVLLSLVRMEFPNMIEAFRALCRMDSETLGVERVSVWLLSEDESELVCHVLYRLSRQTFESGMRLQVKDYPQYFRAIAENPSVPADDACGDPRTCEFEEGYLKPLGITSMMDAGIRVGGKVVGVVCHEHCGPRRHWTPEEQHFAATVAELASLAVVDEQRRRAATQLQRTVSLLQATLESTADGILALDLEGNVVSFNHTFAAMWGIPENLLAPGQKHFVDEIVGRLKDPQICANLAQKLRERPDHVGCEVLELKDGRIFEYFTMPQLLGRQVVGRVWSFRDITERARAEAALHRAKSELETLLKERTTKLSEAVERVKQLAEELLASNAELEAYAYSISHDLRAPLRAMCGYAQALLEDYADSLPEEGKGYLKRIQASAELLDALTLDLLEYARVSQMQMPLSPVNLEEAAARVAGQLEGTIRKSGARITIEPPLLKVVGHEKTVEMILQNLISNAIKFTRRGITPEVQIRSERRGKMVRLWVQDNGIGIPKEHHEKIFKLFQRLHPRDMYAGTGVGLAIVRRACERMAGRCGVESSPGEGSRFWIELPAAEESS